MQLSDLHVEDLWHGLVKLYIMNYIIRFIIVSILFFIFFIFYSSLTNNKFLTNQSLLIMSIIFGVISTLIQYLRAKKRKM